MLMALIAVQVVRKVLGLFNILECLIDQTKNFPVAIGQRPRVQTRQTMFYPDSSI